MGRLSYKFSGKDFGGINAEDSALEPDDNSVARAVNYEMAVSNSLRGRVGQQVICDPRFQFFGIFPYVYNRTTDQYDIVYQTPSGVHPNETPSLATTKTTADGATIQKLVGINHHLWVLDTMNIVITISGTPTYPVTAFSNVGLTQLQFEIQDASGFGYLGNTLLGTGISSYTTIWSLLSTIDAAAGLAVSRTTRGTCPPFAIVNGNQTTGSVAGPSYGTTYRVTVNNTPHNFYVGDVITFPTTPIRGGIVVARSATTIDYIGPSVTLVNGDVLGYMGQSAATFQVDPGTSTSSGNLTIPFPYWRMIPDGDFTSNEYGKSFTSPYTLWGAKTSTSFFAPPTAVNDSGCLYIASSGQQSDGVTGYTNNLLKCDSLAVERAGASTGPTVTATATAAGALTGTYKYKAFLRRVDGQGNIIEGPLSSAVSITYAAQYGTITGSDVLYNSSSGWQGRSAYKRTTESPASGTSFYIDDGGALAPFFQPGDPCYLTDNTAQKAGLWAVGGFGATVIGTLHKTVCTAYDSPNLSIKVADSSGYQINDNTQISAGLTMVFLRTAAGGNQYYELCELPHAGIAGGGQAFLDNVTDAVLTAGTQFTEPTIGKEHNPPPACSLVCQHQGGLVVARGVSGVATNSFFRTAGTNGVSFSSADGNEYFPTASNSFEIPSTQSGAITAIASDTNDRLAVFKERAYYDVVGDLDGGAFSISVKNEGDYGISSQASIARIQDTLIGLCPLGIVLISDGQLDSRTYHSINARYINQSYYFGWACGSNDPTRRQYKISVPTTGSPVELAIDYSREAARVFDRLYAVACDGGAGQAYISNYFYHLSSTSPYVVSRSKYRFNGDNPSVSGAAGDYASFFDNVTGISYILETHGLHFGEPAEYKTPYRIRVWSIPNDYVVDGWTAFKATVETAPSPLSNYIGGSTPGSTTAVMTFTADTDVYQDLRIVSPKTQFFIIRFTSTTIASVTDYSAPFITGFELLVDENYRKEDFNKT